MLSTGEAAMKVNGSCHCAQITYEAEVDPQHVSLCNCTDCQVLTGSAFRVSVPTPAASFRLLTGRPAVYAKSQSGLPGAESAVAAQAAHLVQVGCRLGPGGQRHSRHGAPLNAAVQRFAAAMMPRPLCRAGSGRARWPVLLATVLAASPLTAADDWALLWREGAFVPMASLKRRLADLPELDHPDAFQRYITSKGWTFTRKVHPANAGQAVELKIESQGLALVFVTRDLCEAVARGR